MSDNLTIEAQIQAKEQQWITESNDILALQAEIEKIDARLNSWFFQLNHAVGLTRANISKDNAELISMLDINNLSKDDLETRKNQLLAEIQQKNNLANNLQATAQGLKKQLKNYSQTTQQIFQERGTQAYIQEFISDPDEFFNKSPSADQVIAISGRFNKETNKDHLIQAWNIISAAEKAAAADYKEHISQYKTLIDFKSYDSQTDKIIANNEKYFNAAKQLFVIIANTMPATLQQDIKYLYAMNEHEAVNKYFTQPNITEQDEQALKSKVKVIGNRNARKKLEAIMPTFNNLDTNLQTKLINEQAAITRLGAALEFDVQNNSLRTNIINQTKLLQDKISNLVLNNTTDAERKQIQQKITSEIEANNRNARIKVFGNQLIDPTAIGLGVIGGYLLGPVAALLVSGKAVYEATVYTDIANIEKEREESKIVDPVDYKFIHEMDKYWGVDSSNTGSMAIHTRSFQEQITEQVQYNTNKLTQAITQNETINQAKSDTNKLLIGIASLALMVASLGVLVAFPATWPIFIALIMAAGAGFAGIKIKNYLAETMPGQQIGYISRSIYATLRKGRRHINSLWNPEKEYVISIPTETDKNFRQLSPDLTDKLIADVQARAKDIKESLEGAQVNRNKNDISSIRQELDKLHEDWYGIMAASNPRELKTLVTQYLKSRYLEERKKYLNTAKTNNLVLADKRPTINYAQMREKIKDLKNLNEKASKIEDKNKFTA